jgi:dTDP-4-dehydrorhamnose reductase
MEKLLVLGASGLTGSKVLDLAKGRFEVHGTYNARRVKDSSLVKLDLSERDGLEKIVKEMKPDAVVNATALHNVDYCESHPDQAFYVNTETVAFLAALCNNVGARLVHISTDFVFDGEKKAPYIESDAPNPLSVYARSKLDGEANARKCSSFCIIRPSVVYGWTPNETQGSSSSSGKPQNFALWALSQMKRGGELKIVNDQFASPTLADVLAAVIVRLAVSDKNQTYHVAGTSCINRYDFTRKLAAIMGYPADKIKPVDSKSFTQAARRPLYSCLGCDAVQRDLGYRLVGVDESLAIMRSQIEMEQPDLLGS